MSVVIGGYNKYSITVENEGTGEPIIDLSLLNDIDARLYTERSKVIAKYGNGNIAVEKPTEGVFIVTIDDETSEKLKPFVGDTAYLEGFLLPYKIPFQVNLGVVENNIASND